MVDATGTGVTANSNRPPTVSGKDWAKLTKSEQETAKKEFKETLRRYSEPEGPDRGAKGSKHSPDGSPTDVLAVRTVCPIGIRALPVSGLDTALRNVALPAGEEGAPSMPTVSQEGGGKKHRNHIRDDGTTWNVLVARPVARKEALNNPSALKALMLEWDKLRAQGVWDEKGVKPWA